MGVNVFVKVVPVSTTILNNLESTSELDLGVKEFKKKLLGACKRRMAEYESTEDCAVATLVDPRYLLHD